MTKIAVVVYCGDGSWYKNNQANRRVYNKLLKERNERWRFYKFIYFFWEKELKNYRREQFFVNQGNTDLDKKEINAYIERSWLENKYFSRNKQWKNKHIADHVDTIATHYIQQRKKAKSLDATIKELHQYVCKKDEYSSLENDLCKLQQSYNICQNFISNQNTAETIEDIKVFISNFNELPSFMIILGIKYDNLLQNNNILYNKLEDIRSFLLYNYKIFRCNVRVQQPANTIMHKNIYTQWLLTKIGFQWKNNPRRSKILIIIILFIATVLVWNITSIIVLVLLLTIKQRAITKANLAEQVIYHISSLYKYPEKQLALLQQLENREKIASRLTKSQRNKAKKLPVD